MRAAPRDGVLEPVEQERAVGESGQGVVRRLFDERPLHLLQLGRIAHDRRAVVDRAVRAAVGDQHDAGRRAGPRPGERRLAAPHALAAQGGEGLVVEQFAARPVEQLEDGAPGEREREIGPVGFVDAEASRADPVDAEEQTGRLEHGDDVRGRLEQRAESLRGLARPDLLGVRRRERPLEHLPVAVGPLVRGVDRTQQRRPPLLVGRSLGIERETPELALQEKVPVDLARGAVAHDHGVPVPFRSDMSGFCPGSAVPYLALESAGWHL